ncbi:hypothetical protein QWZ10_21575 [Paracoccus cavernae]|uniref:Uncharacterized protein n=1 Tax=Paracoccus cavernae TaxID=1571207 RepID=A0ABT8DEF3_9RHOB|nr:hypothetical protein [Paracoccus cavernae]
MSDRGDRDKTVFGGKLLPQDPTSDSPSGVPERADRVVRPIPPPISGVRKCPPAGTGR